MRQLHQDPDATPMLGRQPATRLLTPSKGLPWYYGTEVEGQRFTQEQVETLISKGADPVTVPALIVKRQATRDEAWFPTSDIPPRFEMLCPVFGKGRVGKIRVVAPNGSMRDVDPNGWGHRPYRLPDCYRLGAAMGGR